MAETLTFDTLCDDAVRPGLTVADLNPLDLAERWIAEAQATEPEDHNAMAIATADADGLPDVRMVLLKGFDADPQSGGFIFYTNMTSAKGGQILANAQAALNFHWKSNRRVLRARGRLERVSEELSDAYFQSRGRGSRLASMASDQSSALATRQELMDRVAVLENRYGSDDTTGHHVPRPDHWYGHKLVPESVEFWQDGEHRMHNRFRFERAVAGSGAGWSVERLNP
ncbi:MAG: pyridoxamine 5'-phosphate oxidase [Pseudomonadota bacterium]